ncbi:hypothetical protein RN001_000402 [Aquatica leii]|uniref:Uncharacterized protein n=1 Tax=Aquatica leii TaxID=1421715 RepID=A0AAN7SC74_9COLE|nr:hypothetical protein RN001_000402 [Aquatica leii]
MAGVSGNRDILTHDELNAIVQDIIDNGFSACSEFSDDLSEHSDHDTNSDVEIGDTSDDESGDELDQVDDGNGNKTYFYGKNKFKWATTPPANSKTRASNIVTHLPGVRGKARLTKPSTPVQSWECLIDAEELWHKLPRSIFAPIMSKTWENIDPVIIKHGFQKTGIFPFCKTVIPIETYEPQAYKRWCSFKENQANQAVSTDIVTYKAPTAIVPTTVTIAAEENLPIPSTSKVSVSEVVVSTPSTNQKKTFKELLLEQIKQTPKITTGRKRICVGAEVITSEDAIARLEEIKNQRLKKTSK